MPAAKHTEAFDIAEPHAASLAESLRAFGYELPTALADLVDNSIFAGAHNIWIHFHWDGQNSAIAVTDDGRGMNEATLLEAMRPGTRSPREIRDPKDLGRFGLGLKTASFSQCRSVTVRSRRKLSSIFTRNWDLDHVSKVNAWQLLRQASPLAVKLSSKLDKLTQGTAVIWENLDRLTADSNTNDGKAEDHFLGRAEAVRDHLACVFHRFLQKAKPLNIFINGRTVEPWDPFLEKEPATIRQPIENLRLSGQTIEIAPFILPHLSKIDAKTHQRASGTRGWNLHQGYYIYRNERLLVAGDWLGLKGWKPEEHYKLARIRVSLPNTLDHDWEIDVTKSKASPPAKIIRELERIGLRARNVAKEIYSHRGRAINQLTGDSGKCIFLWSQHDQRGQISYRLNRNHPLIEAVRQSSGDRPKLEALLKLVEQTVPVPLIMITDREKPDKTLGPFEGAKSSEISEIMEQIFASLLSGGYGRKEAFDRLRATEPFARFPAELEAFYETHFSS